jgi:hypothetical protein
VVEVALITDKLVALEDRVEVLHLVVALLEQVRLIKVLILRHFFVAVALELVAPTAAVTADQVFHLQLLAHL